MNDVIDDLNDTLRIAVVLFGRPKIVERFVFCVAMMFLALVERLLVSVAVMFDVLVVTKPVMGDKKDVANM